jgi:CheY-like chemotaxis protein
MSRLSVLVAEDQEKEVEHAVIALRAQGHEVVTAHTFEEAKDWAQRGGFDVAVIDLGWYMDRDFVRQHGKTEAGNAGWNLDDLVVKQSPDAVRILYTTRTSDKDGESIVARAAEKKMLLVKKYDSGSQQHLASVATFVAQRVAEARAGQVQKERSRRLFRALISVTAMMAMVLLAAGLLWALTRSAAAASVLLGVGVALALGLATLVLTATRDLEGEESRPFLEAMVEMLKMFTGGKRE